MDFVKALALGGDAVAIANSAIQAIANSAIQAIANAAIQAIANAAIQAIGCLGMRACHTDPPGGFTATDRTAWKREAAELAGCDSRGRGRDRPRAHGRSGPRTPRPSIAAHRRPSPPRLALEAASVDTRLVGTARSGVVEVGLERGAPRCRDAVRR